MRIPEYNGNTTPNVAPAPNQGSGVIHLPKVLNSGASGAISKSLASSSDALGARNTPQVTGAERMLDYAAKAAAALGAHAEKLQADNDEMDFHLFKAQSDNALFNIMDDIAKNGHYSGVVDRGNELWGKHSKEALEDLQNKRIAKRAEDYLKLRTISVQADFYGTYLKRQLDDQKAKYDDASATLIVNRDSTGLEGLINSASFLSEEQKGNDLRAGIRRISLLNVTDDLQSMGIDWVYSEEKYPGLLPEDIQSAHKDYERETKSFKIEIIRDDLIKRYGMNYAAARKEILDKYQGDEEQLILSRYEGWYSDQKRIQQQAQSAAQDNFFKKLQSFESKEEALEYALKNSKSLSGYNDARRFINAMFDKERATNPEAFNQILQAIADDKFNNLTTAQFKAAVLPYLSSEDYNEYVLPAFKEHIAMRKAEAKEESEIRKSHRSRVNSLLADDIRIIDKGLKNDNETLYKLKRRYEEDWKANPNMSIDEALKLYQKLAAKENVGSWYSPKYIYGVDKVEEKEKGGVQYNQDTNRWEVFDDESTTEQSEPDMEDFAFTPEAPTLF